MPIYEYQCTKCEHKLEALQKMSEKPLRDCPACGKSGLNKLISAASFRLKGGGWYETDFKTGNKKQLAESESATSGGTNSEKSGNSEKSAGEKPD
jgi:putative FmdB family regulatory protein